MHYQNLRIADTQGQGPQHVQSTKFSMLVHTIPGMNKHAESGLLRLVESHGCTDTSSNLGKSAALTTYCMPKHYLYTIIMCLVHQVT